MNLFSTGVTYMSEHGRDEHGRFLPGNPGGPGRKSRQSEQEYLTAFSDAFPPDVLVEMAQTAWDIAVKQNSTRGMNAVLQTVMPYVMGKPAQTVSVNSNASALLAEIMSNSAPLFPFPFPEGETLELTGTQPAIEASGKQ
jgi:hypothetical protein